MSLRLKIDVRTAIFDFKNIELFNQGCYYVEIQFYVQTANAKYLVPPDEYENISWDKSQIVANNKN